MDLVGNNIQWLVIHCLMIHVHEIDCSLLSSPQVVQLVHSSRNMVFLHSTSDTITVLASTQNFRTDGLSIGLQLCNHVVHTSSMLERVDELGVKSQLRKRRDTSPVHALSNEWFKSYVRTESFIHIPLGVLCSPSAQLVCNISLVSYVSRPVS